MSAIGRRVIVIGNTSSGKSTLAATLARSLEVPFVELDALNWEPNWVEAPDAVLRARVADATSGAEWVVAGNYLSKTQDLTWPRVETVIYLDYSLPFVLWRVLARSWRRWRSRELLWGTNTESFWKHLSSWDDSLLVWAMKSHAKHRARWPELVTDPRWAHVRFVRLCSQRETDRWLAGALAPEPNSAPASAPIAPPAEAG
ncbi:MAG: adenylate kinase [Dehalococcoidia bacterium]